MEKDFLRLKNGGIYRLGRCSHERIGKADRSCNARAFCGDAIKNISDSAGSTVGTIPRNGSDDQTSGFRLGSFGFSISLFFPTSDLFGWALATTDLVLFFRAWIGSFIPAVVRFEFSVLAETHSVVGHQRTFRAFGLFL